MDRTKLSSQIEKIEVGVVIVTHNSQASITQTLQALNAQTYPLKQIVLIDSGSTQSQYLKVHDHQGPLEMCLMPNIGFSAGNNLGYASLLESIQYILFLNPDVILPKDFIEKAINWITNTPNKKVGAFTGPLLGWDLEKEKPTGLIDSTGIFSTWYGKWYDRGQGLSVKYHKQKNVEAVAALCGALIFAKREALESVKIGAAQIFDPSFFCYKEDIELSLRLRKKGWQLLYVPELEAFHARGWQKERKSMSRQVRLMSAKNELKIHLKLYNPIKITYSLMKWMGVKVFNL